MELAFAKLKVPTLKITGSVTPAKRVEAQNTFQAAGGPRIMLINTMAGGVAIDLDQHSDELFFMDETFIPDEQEQVEDRIHRVSRIHQVTIHYLYAKGSIDEKIAQTNIAKDEIQKRILDGRRGVDFALRILQGEE
jgi:SNF2 family DNA or RNA helicase